MKQQLFWFSVWGHSWEFERDANWDLFDRFCDLVDGRADIWYATVIDVFDYLKAARVARVAVSGAFAENPTAGSVWLTGDDQPIEIPAGARIVL